MLNFNVCFDLVPKNFDRISEHDGKYCENSESIRGNKRAEPNG